MNRLNEIEARANAATEGPWQADGSAHVLTADNTPTFVARCADPDDSDAGVPDAEFIAHARADVPDMAAALRAVLEIHQDGGESQGYLDDGSYGFIPHCCMECGSLGEYGVPYPCQTVETIRRYLGDDL